MLLKTVTQTVWKKHWGWIIFYLVFQIATATASYWTSDYVSVLYSLVVDTVATLIGLTIVVKAVTITKDH